MLPSEMRPDMDIEEEIGQLIRSYSPLKLSRGYFTYQVVNGHVVIIGNVRTPQARRVLLDNVPRIRGVVSLDASRLYDDEMVRVMVGHLLPPGVFASVHFGAVALTGRPPENTSTEIIVEAVRRVPGVRRVGAELGAEKVITGTEPRG